MAKISEGIKQARSMTQQVNEFERKLQVGRRDRFIAAALTGLCTNGVTTGTAPEQEVAAKAIRIANAVIEQDRK
jgi:hypothetical protein